MANRITGFRSLIGAMLLACLAAPAAASYSQIIAFGDSLSDTGNLFKLTSFLPTGGIPGAPYYQGRFSNGLVAVESMASALGLSLTSQAIGGAQTGPGNEGGAVLYGTGVSGQIQRYEASHNRLDTNALYFLWAGANDFYTGNNIYSTTTYLTSSSNMLSNIRNLYNHGARDFFVPLMPDLSQTPEALNGTASYQSAALARTQEYNGALSAGLQSLSSSLTGANIVVFDTPAFMQKTVPTLAAAGLDVTDACYDTKLESVCSFQEQYLFWDNVHPTNTGHWILGQAFASAVQAVPEPGALYLEALGLVSMMWARRRQRQR
ncbi:SGNH/GDSL hydrolase family protein [Aquabacterium sp. NJ1]|uniref:SGNH/GDSL hydrolase family protein n=1 Tax=Aquabacterium sp. NJ1 TaxID=1538295 RepID=UPI001378EEC9|nr:SGNH/GDSL hydrolase family protein [Aquabacterium sp. NJ1]